MIALQVKINKMVEDSWMKLSQRFYHEAVQDWDRVSGWRRYNPACVSFPTWTTRVVAEKWRIHSSMN